MAQLGDRIGHIRIVDFLAKGGMGDVFVGYDEKLQRKVALKAIRSEFRLHADAKARFLREARVLSQLEHPHICRIYDILETEDGDYLVLELIHGQSLKAVLREGLEDSDKWRIAEQIVQVLTAAHGKGVVHRDLKPDNVMIAADGDIKVLDFGLARTQEEDQGTTGVLSDQPTQSIDGGQLPSTPPKEPRAISTEHGVVMGTLGYMSPEQANGEPASTASDMYSFGLILQQVFTGRPPYDITLSKQILFDKATKGETLPVEGVDPDLAALIRRLKSLAPAARPSAVDAWERLRWIAEKPKRQRKRILAITGVAFLAVVALVMAGLSYRLYEEVQRANREATTAQQVSDFLVRLFEVSDPSEARGNSITARELLDQGSVRIERDLEDQPLTQARLADTMGTVYRTLGLYDRAEPLLRQALDVRRRLLGEGSTEVAQSLNSLAIVIWYQGKLEEAEKLFREALEIQKAAAGEESPLSGDVLNNLAGLYWTKGDRKQAEQLCEKSLAIRKKVLNPDDPRIAKSLLNLATLYDQDGQDTKAEELYREALSAQERRLGSDHPDLVPTLNNFAAFYDERGKYDQALPLYQRSLAIAEKTLGKDHPNTATAANNLADVYQKQGKNSEAEPLYMRSLGIWEKSLGTSHPDLGYALTGLANVYRDEGDLARSEQLYKRALAVRENSRDTDPADTAETLAQFSKMLAKAGRTQEAADMEARAKKLQEEE